MVASRKRKPNRPRQTRLDRLIEEAIVDACGGGLVLNLDVVGDDPMPRRGWSAP